MSPKRHLVRRTPPPPVRAACGVRNPTSLTTDPAEVTCAGCARTVLMADAEMRKQLEKNTKKRRRFPVGNQKRSNQ